MVILSVNAGSSSLKFQAFDMPEEKLLISGVFERIGIDNSFYTIKLNGEKIKKEVQLPNHKVAFEILIKELIDNVWTGVTSFNDDLFASMVLYLHNNKQEKYSKQLVESFDDVNRNWELMQLQFVPYKEIIKEVVKLS